MTHLEQRNEGLSTTPPPAGRRAWWRVLAKLPRRAGRIAVRGYQLTLSPLVGLHCRHLPTCSAYADEALAQHGLWAGGWMTLARLCRCHPLGTAGLDFVPERPPARAAWYLPWRYGRWRGTNAPAFEGAKADPGRAGARTG